ncbi:unnamed protein product [Leuciscus chuanchicus]
MLPRQKPHGWSHEIEVAVCLYWLACGTSYRVIADIFAIPRATVGRIVHSIVDDMMAIVHKEISNVQGVPISTSWLLSSWRRGGLQHPLTLMTPYRQPVAGQVEARFNKHHAKARNIIESTFGMLKTRWRAIFLRALEIQPLFAPKVIAAFCILHNLCLSTDDILEEEEEEEELHDEDEDRGNVPDEDLRK